VRSDGVGAATISSQDDRVRTSLRVERWAVAGPAPVVTDLGNGDIMATKVGDTSVTLVGTPARETAPALSSDGRWLAYMSDESGAFEIYVRPFPEASTARWQVSTAGGSYPLWSRSGRELFYRNNNNELVSAMVSTSPTFSVGAQKSLFSLSPFTPAGPVPLYSVAPVDKRFLMLQRDGGGRVGAPGGVSQNWFEELRGG
jgi:hypothetical protein